MSTAAVAQGAEVQQMQYVVQLPQQGVVLAAAPQPVAYMGASGAFPMTQPAGQVMYVQEDGQQVFPEGQQIYYIQGGEQQVLPDGQGLVGGPAESAQVTYAAPEGMDGQQFMYSSPMVVAAPARVNVSHDLFAKLAAGGSLTPEEMAQISGQPSPAPVLPGSPQKPAAAVQPGSPQNVAVPIGAADPPVGAAGQAAPAPGSAKPSGKKEKKDKKDKSDKSASKKALKASKKKKEKGCC